MGGKRPDLYQHMLQDLKTGVDEMFFLLGDGLLPRDVILRSFDLFATKVMPRFASA